MKMGKVATASVLAIAVACAMPALSDVVLENDAFVGVKTGGGYIAFELEGFNCVRELEPMSMM